MSDSNETVVKVRFEPDTASLNASASEAGKAIEAGIGKASPDVKINLNTQAIDVASNAIQSIHDRMQMLPNISKTAENQMTRAFEKVGEAMNKLETGKISGDKFNQIFDNMVQYANEAVIKAENKLKGTPIKLPPIEIPEIDTSKIDKIKAKLEAAFGHLRPPKMPDIQEVEKSSETAKQKMERYMKNGVVKGPKIVVDDVDTAPAENALMSAFTAIGQVIGGKFMINMAKGMWKEIDSVGSKILDLKIQLEGMLGDDQGNSSFNYLSELASQVPGDVGDMITAYKSLVNQGIYPTENAMKSLTTFAISQGHDVERLSQAITSAQMGQFMRLKAFGVQVNKNGNKLTMSFRGQTKTINNTKQAITDYMASLGELPGMAELAEKRMATLTGMQDKFRDSMNLIKFTIYEQLNKTLAPLFEKFNKIVDGIQKWVEVNPQLATTIAVVVMATLALTGAIIVLTGAIAVLETVGAPIIAVIAAIMLVIGSLVFVIWDLYNGIANGNSYILWAIDSFLEWAGVSWTVQDAIDWITQTLDEMITFFNDTVLPIWEIVWSAMSDIVSETLDWIGGYIGVCIDIWVGLFTGNIPKATQGFVSLAKGIASIFVKIGAAAAKLVAYILRIFAKGVAQMADMVKDVPILGDAMAGLANFSNRGADNIEGFSLAMDDWGDENSFGSQVRENRSANSGKKRQQKPRGSDKKSSGLGTGPGGTGTGKNGGGKNGGGKGKNKGKGNGEDKDALDKATIIAIEGIEDVLKKMGFSLEKKIDKADIFQAQKNAMLEMMMSKDKTGILDNYYKFKEINGKSLTNNSDYSRGTVNVFMGSSQVSTNKLNIKSNSTLEDVMNIGKKVNGG